MRHVSFIKYLSVRFDDELVTLEHDCTVPANEQRVVDVHVTAGAAPDLQLTIACVSDLSIISASVSLEHDVIIGGDVVPCWMKPFACVRENLFAC